jgi:integrase
VTKCPRQTAGGALPNSGSSGEVWAHTVCRPLSARNFATECPKECDPESVPVLGRGDLSVSGAFITAKCDSVPVEGQRVIGQGRETLARRRYQKGSLRLRGKRNNQVWVLRWREDVVGIDGRVRREERKRIVGTKKELPTEKLARRRADLVLDRVNRPDYRPIKSAAFTEFVERWKASALSVMKPSTRKAAESHLRCYLLPRLGMWKLEQLATEDVQILVAELGTKLSRHTIRNVMATLSSVLSKARKWGYLVGDVNLSAVEVPDIRPRRKARFFTAREATSIIQTAEEPWRTIFAVAALTALRPGEVLGLTVDDLDFENGSIHVRQSAYYSTIQTPKNARSIGTVCMPASLAAILREHCLNWEPNPKRLLFATRNGTPHAENKVVQRKLWPILDALKIPRCGLHAFRHTHSSLLLATGASPVVTQAQLRHSDPLITLRNYAHLMGSEQREAVEKVAAMILPQNTDNLRPNAAKSETNSLILN